MNWWGVLKGTAAEFRAANLTDWAAALTYYGLLSLFPALIAMVSILGLFGDPDGTTRVLTETVTSLGPEGAAETFAGPIESITSSRGRAGAAFVLALLVALWSGSSYVNAFVRASNAIHGRSEPRPFWKLRPLELVVTLAMILLLALLALALVLTGPVVDAAADAVGISTGATVVWDLARWPLVAFVFVLVVGMLYYATPSARPRGLLWVTPGSVVALVIWVVASAGFAAYVANFSSYAATYGALAGVVVLLVWLWIGNLAILFGHQLNAELERNHRPAPTSDSN